MKGKKRGAGISFRSRMNPLRAMILCRFGGISNANNEVRHNGWTATTGDGGKFQVISPRGEIDQLDDFEALVARWEGICKG